MGPVYLDANPVAYAFEGPEELAAALKDLFALFRGRTGLAVTSDLTLAGVLPKRKTPDRQFLDLLIWSGIFDLRSVTPEILTEAAPYRRMAAVRRPDGTLAFPKLPDAIHVVTAIRSGCSIFVSSDGRLRLPNTMRLVSPDFTGITELVRELT
jgi:predicted nucleic acid-binding protein